MDRDFVRQNSMPCSTSSFRKPALLLLSITATFCNTVWIWAY